MLKTSSDTDLVQIWYHGNISHEEAKRLLLSNAAYDIGAFLIRRSVQRQCYCLSYLYASYFSQAEILQDVSICCSGPNCSVRSIEIGERRTEENKLVYFIAQKTFDSIADLVASYRTYDFNEIVTGSTDSNPVRLSKPIPRERWYQELLRKPWYQPDLSRRQAEELLRGVSRPSSDLLTLGLSR